MPENKLIKVIIDTNLWISFLIGKELANLKDLIVDRTIQPVISEQLLEELILVTQRPKLQKYFSLDKVNDLIQFLKIIGFEIEIKSEVTICRDAKDNYLLAIAKDSKANFLITGDQDLLILKIFEDTEILTYSNFLLKINQPFN